MELYKEMEGRLFTASVPNLDLSTILFVVIVEAAFLAGNYLVVGHFIDIEQSPSLLRTYSEGSLELSLPPTGPLLRCCGPEL